MSALAAVASLALNAAAHPWTDNTGKYRVDAEFIALAEDAVQLRRHDGKVIRVPLRRLSTESRALARQLAEQAAAIATSGQAKPEPLMAGEMILAPDETLRRLAAELAAHRARAAWDALPGSYQRELATLVHQSAAQLDPQVGELSLRLLKKTVHLFRDKRAMIVAHPLFVETIGGSAAERERTCLALASALDALAASDAARSQALRTLDLGKFLATTGESILRELAAAHIAHDETGNSILRRFVKTEVAVVQNDGQRAVVRLKLGEAEADNELVLVEGKWIPAPLADEWPRLMAGARRAIAGLSAGKASPQKSALLTNLAAIDRLLDQLLAAADAQQFAQTLSSVAEPESLSTAVPAAAATRK